MESTSVKQAKYHLLLNLSKKLNYPLVKPETMMEMGPRTWPSFAATPACGQFGG
jgi:hypothetical protein